jgi:hypothetical protein
MLTLLSQRLIDVAGSMLALTVVQDDPTDSLGKLDQLLPIWQ